MTLGLIALLALLFVAPFALYPVLIRLVPSKPLVRGHRPASWPTVSVLIPAYNEEEHVEEKLENTLSLDYPADKLEILLCSDGSTDATAALAERFATRGVKVLINEVRSGKAATLNRLAAAATGEVLLLTDASAKLSPNALADLVSALSDERVGVASARYVVTDADQAASVEAEAGYWRFEAELRREEADRDLLIGVSGAAYVLRRHLFTDIPADTVNDDYVVPLRVRLAGHRVAFVPEALARDKPTASASMLYLRWVRIAFGNYQMLWRHRGAFLHGRLALPLTRKLLRTVGPLLLLGGALTLAVGALSTPGLRWPLAMVGLLGVGALAVALRPGGGRLTRVVRFGLTSQLAYLAGLARFLTGRRQGIWRRAALPPLDFARPAAIPLRVRVVKRALDIVASTVALILLAPLMLVLGIAIRWESEGPAIYRQKRLGPGPDGKPREFNMLKFRSMRKDAEKNGPVWAESQKEKKDQRVTRIGEFIRNHRLDEILQFVNVLKGEMSLVGPRPEREFFVAQLAEMIPGFEDRHALLKPGITGWAQVQCGYADSTESSRDKLAFDLVYLAHLYRLRSYVRIEISILFRTVGVVLTGKGAR